MLQEKKKKTKNKNPKLREDIPKAVPGTPYSLLSSAVRFLSNFGRGLGLIIIYAWEVSPCSDL